MIEIPPSRKFDFSHATRYANKAPKTVLYDSKTARYHSKIYFLITIELHLITY